MEIAALAYSVVTATDPASWVRFGEDIAGFSAHPVPGGIALRMDERAGRIFIEPGGADRYFASGWEVRTRRDFAAALAELAAKGVAFTPGRFFGPREGEGFLRFNFACPHSQTLEAVRRLEWAIKQPAP